MTDDQALQFLSAHQPMPSDHNISDVQAQQYAEVLCHFLENPDIRCIPLLINSVSRETGLGMYERIEDVLLKQPRNDVITHLVSGLKSHDPGVRSRCCHWALALSAVELSTQIASLKTDTDQDTREAAELFLSFEFE